MPTLLHLSEHDVAAAFTIDVALASQRAAFEALGRGDAVLPQRLLVPGAGDDVAFCYAARAGRTAPAVSKFGAVHASNTTRGIPAVHALVTALDPETGIPTCVMSGTTLTTLRTAAASAVAIDALAAADAGDVAIVGTGVQAEAHARAICAVRDVRRIRVVGRDRAKAQALAERWRTSAPAGAPPIDVVDSVAAACAGADIIALCTTATSPVVEAEWIADGAVVVTVGSFSADRCEVPAALMREARVVVDDRDTALADNGSVVQPVDAGVLDPARVETLGEVLTGGRDGAGRVTVYASVGVGVQDAAAADAVLEVARRRGVGTTLEN